MLPGYIGNNNSPNNRHNNVSNTNSINMTNNPRGPNVPQFRRMNAFNQDSAIEEYSKKLFDQLGRKYETVLDKKIQTTGLQQLAQLNSKTNRDFVNAKDEVLASWRASLPAPLDADDFNISSIEKRAFKDAAQRMMPPDVFMNYFRRNLKAAKEAAKRDPHKVHPAPFSYVPAEEASTGCKGKSCTIMGGRRKTIKRQRGGICPCALGTKQGGSEGPIGANEIIEQINEIMNRYGCGVYTPENVRNCNSKLGNMLGEEQRGVQLDTIYNDYNELYRLRRSLPHNMQGGKTNAKIVAIEEADEIMNRYGCGTYSEDNAQSCINKIYAKIESTRNIGSLNTYTNDYNRLFYLRDLIRRIEDGQLIEHYGNSYVRIEEVEGGAKKGGGCGCSASKVSLTNLYGGYKATRKDKQLYKKYKKGLSIGFTGRSSLKAKGILPRSNGRYILGPKYSGTGKPKILKKATKTRKTNRR